MKEDVRVGLDESREQSRVFEHQALGTGRHRDAARWTRSLDPLSSNDDPPSGMETLAVEDPRRLDHADLGQKKSESQKGERHTRGLNRASPGCQLRPRMAY